MKVLCFIILASLALSSCTLVDPLTRAQNLTRKGNFEQAIEVLEKEYKGKPSSVPVKSILAQTYSNYGLVLCRDESKPPKVKYPLAKKQFSMALALNPSLTDAKLMYEMIEKIQISLQQK